MKRYLSLPIIEPQSRLFHYGALGVFLVSSFFLYLGGYPLLDNNEGLYAAIPREMLLNDQYIIPFLNGVPYIEKPPLLYWLICISYKFFGISEASARLVPALSGLGICLSMLTFTRQHRSKDVSWLSPLILCTSIGFIIFSRMVIFDVLYAFFFTLTALQFYRWFSHGQKSSLRYAYLMLGLAVMTKGFAALVLAGGIVFIYAIVTRPSTEKIKQFFDLWGLLIFFCVTLPWHVLASLQHQGFAWFYLINEHVLRFLDLREPHDYYRGPIYYYLPRLFLYLFPWSLFIPLIFKKTERQGKEDKNYFAFLWIWFLVPLIFFSLSKAKANYYMVLGLPPLVLLIAEKLKDLLDHKSRLPLIFTCITAALVTIALIAVYTIDFGPKAQPFQQILTPLHLGFWLTAILVSFLTLYHTPFPTLLSPKIMGLYSLCLLIIILTIAPAVSPYYSTKNLVDKVPQEYRHHIFLYKDFEKISTVPFYSGHPVPIIDSVSNDLLYGENSPYKSYYFPTLNEVIENSKQQKIYIIGLKKVSQKLEDRKLHRVDGDNRLVLYTNQP